MIPWLESAFTNEWTALTATALDGCILLNFLVILCCVFCGGVIVLFTLKPFKARKFPRFGDSEPEDVAEATPLQFHARARQQGRAPSAEGLKMGAGTRVLLVTAHPDDECMFFGPTIVELIDAGALVYVLCFSTGSYGSNCPRTRKRELLESCSILRIPRDNVTLLNFSNLPDDPKANWSTNIIAALVLRYVETYRCDAVITFDRGGVSDHPNHKALFCGVQLLLFTRMLPPYCTFLCLKTVKTSLKYVPFLEVPVAYLRAPIACLASLRQRYRIQRAMKAHASQMVWFRQLYIMFSRYLYLNTFDVVCESISNRTFKRAPEMRRPMTVTPSSSSLPSPPANISVSEPVRPPKPASRTRGDGDPRKRQRQRVAVVDATQAKGKDAEAGNPGTDSGGKNRDVKWNGEAASDSAGSPAGFSSSSSTSRDSATPAPKKTSSNSASKVRHRSVAPVPRPVETVN